MPDTRTPQGTTFQVSALVALRLLIGWHFLYEGLAKVISPYWSSAPYLGDSQWIFKNLFIGIASNSAAITTVDYLNMWGLTLIGLGLMFGLFERAAIIAGIVVLALYYVAAPPFPSYRYAMPSEGSYLLVNKVLIELSAMLVLLAYPTAKQFGLDRFLVRGRAGSPAPQHATT